VLLVGTDQRITSGPAATTAAFRGRIHGCTRTIRGNVRFFSLAPRAPSIHGTSRHLPRCRIRRELGDKRTKSFALTTHHVGGPRDRGFEECLTLSHSDGSPITSRMDAPIPGPAFPEACQSKDARCRGSAFAAQSLKFSRSVRPPYFFLLRPRRCSSGTTRSTKSRILSMA
jgi:hypothetical protein